MLVIVQAMVFMVVLPSKIPPYEKADVVNFVAIYRGCR